MGLINHVFNADSLKKLYPSNLGIGHTRYSTSGISELQNCQPFVVETLHGKIAVAHNGELTNAVQLRRKVSTSFGGSGIVSFWVWGRNEQYGCCDFSLISNCLGLWKSSLIKTDNFGGKKSCEGDSALISLSVIGNFIFSLLHFNSLPRVCTKQIKWPKH